MKKNAMGNGSTQCVLCGDEFGLLGASPTFCDDCRKVSCFLSVYSRKTCVHLICPNFKKLVSILLLACPFLCPCVHVCLE